MVRRRWLKGFLGTGASEVTGREERSERSRGGTAVAGHIIFEGSAALPFSHARAHVLSIFSPRDRERLWVSERAGRHGNRVGSIDWGTER